MCRRRANVTNILADLSQRAGIHEIFDAIGEMRIDILVNNAGIGSSEDPRLVVDFDDAFWEKTLYVNLTVPYLLSKTRSARDAEGWARPDHQYRFSGG